MTIKVGINGFGRIGRLALRAAWDWPELEFVQINDPAGDAATHAHLLNFDSVHGRWQHEAGSDGDAVVINGKRIRVTANKAIADTDWSGCDLVLEVPLPNRDACEQILTECLTELGEIFKGIEKLPHEAGFKRVVADTVGLDGRTIRKVVANALASRKEVAVAPAKLTLADIQSAVALAKAARQKGKQ